MIKILFDADLILEALMNRNGCGEEVSKFLDKVHPLIQMYITDIGWQKIYTYASHLRDNKVAEIVIDWLKEKIKICHVDQTILQQARTSALEDFESAVELCCVSYEKLDAVVTHKLSDFTQDSPKYYVWSVAELWVRANLESQLQTTKFG
ncbi:MAG: PIN domain-containing protein [Nostochopsis sp.]